MESACLIEKVIQIVEYKKMSVKFSIVIPVFNTERFLSQCLESFAAQTDGDFEAIVVDDGSQGNCEEIVAKFDSRFRCLRHGRNLSLLQARITGLHAAVGDVVVPFDSDDYAFPELLARLRSEFANVADADVVVCQMVYDKNGRSEMPSIRYADERMTGEEAIDRLLSSRIQCGVCGKAIRREVYLKAIEELGIGREFYLNSSEDLCQTFPVLLNSRRVSTISYPGYRYRLNDESLTSTLTDPVKMGRAAENTRRVFDLLSKCVYDNGHDISLVARLEKFLEPTLEWYLGCIRHLPEREWRLCAVELCRCFPPDLVARKAMELIENSATYRLGKLIATPLRLLKGRR